MEVRTMTRDRWGRRWVLRGARLSLLVGSLSGGVQAWGDFSSYQAELKRVVTSQIGYECAARLSDSLLMENQNDFGNINIRRFGCADDDFYVSLKEVQDVRTGEMKFTTVSKPFDLISVLIAFVSGALATLLLSAAAVALAKAVIWVWRV